MKTFLIVIMLVFFLELSNCSSKQARTSSLIQKSQVHLHELKVKLTKLIVKEPSHQNKTRNATNVTHTEKVLINPVNFTSSISHSKKENRHVDVKVVSNVTSLNSPINVDPHNTPKICEEIKVVSDIVSQVDGMVGELSDAFNDHIANLVQSKKSAVSTVDQNRWKNYATSIVDFFITKTNDLRDIIDNISNLVEEVERKDCVSSSVLARKSLTGFLERVQVAAARMGLGTNYVQMKLTEIKNKVKNNLRASKKMKN